MGLIDVRFIPLDRWPTEATRSRQESRFRAGYSETLDLLETELRHLNAREIVIQAFFRRDQIRNDGWPYANANPTGPGVILSFTSKGKSLSFPCDRFNTLDCNLRAIALSLQALRAVDRYGVTKRAEQYQGWARIEAPLPGGFKDKWDAAAFVATWAGEPSSTESAHEQLKFSAFHNAQTRQSLYRAAAARLHPDRAVGSHELFVKLQQAMAVLESTNGQ